MSKEEPARRYALYIPTIGKRRPGRPRTSYLNYVQRLLGDNEGAMQEQQIAAFADDRRAWRNLVVACSAADGAERARMASIKHVDLLLCYDFFGGGEYLKVAICYGCPLC